MKIIGQGEYHDIISRYFQSSFPAIAAIKGKDMLDVITQILVGSKDLRYGSMPSPENLVTIRKTIMKSVEMGHPIPVLVPWGGRKMDKHLQMDVAEVFALKQLLRVDECIRKVYEPGLRIRVRIEDINAKWLYKEETGIEGYSDGLQRLINILKGDTKIIGVRESEMMDEGEYMKLAAEYAELLNSMITMQMDYPRLKAEDIPAYQTLLSRGWKGTIPQEQRDYYIERYKRMYPGLESSEYIGRLAEYFAGSKARYDLNGRGEPKDIIGSFIQINFAHQVPGAPDGIFNNTLYYRTIPGNMSRTHIAPWRSKGYLQMIEEQVTPKLVFPGVEIRELEKSYVTFINENDEDDKVIVRADYTYSMSMFSGITMLPPMI